MISKDGFSTNGSRKSPNPMPMHPRMRRQGLVYAVAAVATTMLAAGWIDRSRAQEITTQPATEQVSAEATSPPGTPADPGNAVVLSGEGGKLRATIQTAEVAREQVVVAIGSSAVLDLNAPIKRAEVANPEVAQLTVLSPRQVLISGAAIGTTQVILWDEHDERLVFGVLVEPNLEQLRAAIRRTAPDADVDVRVVSDTVILSGRVHTVDDAQRIEELTMLVFPKVQNQLDVAGQQQVLLRCTVAEVSKSAIRSLGVDAWASFEDNSPRVNALDLSGVDPSLIGPTAGVPGVGGTAFFGNRFLFGSDDGGFQTTISSQSLQMELFVRAMQENGLLRVLAEPNLVALSGQKAEFLAGGEFPVPVPQATVGGTTITIEWKPFGVILQFVPTVIGQNMIRLNVAPELSEIDFSTSVQIEGFVIPGVTQRSTSTTIELASGSTIAIAGLLSEELRGSVNKIPYLGDVPILGTLFRSVEYQRDMTELVVLVTPELVSAMHPDQVPPAPVRDTPVPNDWQLYGLGMLEGEPSAEDDPTRTGALHTTISPRFRRFTSPPEQMSLHGPWGPADASETVVE